MSRSRRALIAFATTLTVVAAPALLTPRPAAATDIAVLGLSTDAELDGGLILTVRATGSFTGGIIANNAVALQIAGTETYVNDDGVPITVPLYAAPAALRFASSNVVQWQWVLHGPDSTVHVDWTAEALGLAPTPFTGTCAGTFTLYGGVPVELKSC